jgi:hypothetical protein
MTLRFPCRTSIPDPQFPFPPGPTESREEDRLTTMAEVETRNTYVDPARSFSTAAQGQSNDKTEPQQSHADGSRTENQQRRDSIEAGHGGKTSKHPKSLYRLGIHLSDPVIASLTFTPTTLEGLPRRLSLFLDPNDGDEEDEMAYHEQKRLLDEASARHSLMCNTAQDDLQRGTVTHSLWPCEGQIDPGKRFPTHTTIAPIFPEPSQDNEGHVVMVSSQRRKLDLLNNCDD